MTKEGDACRQYKARHHLSSAYNSALLDVRHTKSHHSLIYYKFHNKTMTGKDIIQKVKVLHAHINYRIIYIFFISACYVVQFNFFL